MSIKKMTEQERRKYLFLQAFYLKVKDLVSEVESKLNLPDDPEERSDKFQTKSKTQEKIQQAL